MGHPAHISLTDRLRGIESEIAAGRAESALPRCQEIATLFPRALAVQRVLGEIYLALRRPREALAALDRALTGDPEDARACCARAIVHQMHGDQLAALAWYRRACDIRPEDTTIRATYREMAAALGQPPYQPGRVGLARLYLRGDLFTHAIREWETLIAENSDSTRLEAHVGLVETLWRAGRDQDAEAWARRTLTNAPSCLKPLLIAGVVAHDEGRDDDAEPFLRRATDLDPDHRAARALFSDRLGAGDTALGALLWGETPPSDGAPPVGGGNAGAPQTPVSQSPTPTSGMRPTQPAERRINRPLVTGEPGNAGNTGNAAALSLSRPDLTAPAPPLPPPTAQLNNLPPGFHSMFKETEGMLWRPGDSDPDARRATTIQAAAHSAPPPAALSMPGPSPTDAVAPPAIAESGFALGDTEMRRAIRWVQWLQAQGARALGDEPERARPSGSLDALFNSPASTSYPTSGADRARKSAPPVTSLPSAPSGALPSDALPPSSGEPPSVPPPSIPPSISLPSMPSGAPPSMPPASMPPASMPPASMPPASMPPPSSADLRQMFAELEPGGREQDGAGAIDVSAISQMFAELDPGAWERNNANIVDASIVPLGAPQVDAPQESAVPNAPAEWPASLADALSWPDDDAAHETSRASDLPAMRIEERTTGPIPPPDAPAGPTPDATIEELDRLGMADGFTPFTIEPGALASMAGETGPAREAEREDDWLETRAPEPPATPAEPPRTHAEPEPPMTFAEPEREPEPPAAPLLTSHPAAPDPHDYAARLAQARGHRDSGALDEAIVEYRTVVRNAPELLPDVLTDVESCLTERPEHPELHRLLGDARIRQGDYLGALESYNRAVALTQSLDG